MTKQEANFIGSMNMCDEISNEAYKKIMCNCEVLEQQPSKDCISRTEAINVVHKYFVKYLKINDDICLDGIRSLPSTTPQQIDKIENSNYSEEQYKADLQGAYDCGYNCGYADAMNDIAESEGEE